MGVCLRILGEGNMLIYMNMLDMFVQLQRGICGSPG